MVGFPALVEMGDAVCIEVFDEPDVAATKNRAGLRRLFALQIKDALKYLEKNIPDLQKMSVAYMGLGTSEELRQQILDVAVDRAFLVEPLPNDEASFKRRVDEGRGRLTLRWAQCRADSVPPNGLPASQIRKAAWRRSNPVAAPAAWARRGGVTGSSCPDSSSTGWVIGVGALAGTGATFIMSHMVTMWWVSGRVRGASSSAISAGVMRGTSSAHTTARCSSWATSAWKEWVCLLMMFWEN